MAPGLAYICCLPFSLSLPTDCACNVFTHLGTPHYLLSSCFQFSCEVGIANKNKEALGFPGGAVVENLPANAGHTGSSPGLGTSHMLRSN